jgi:hypothetical protein
MMMVMRPWQHDASKIREAGGVCQARYGRFAGANFNLEVRWIEGSREGHREKKALRAAFSVGAEESVWQFADSGSLRPISS